ncbi:MAG: hypothetical protein ACE5JD_05150 [Candidatus Methylomirabilia bacterium]
MNVTQMLERTGINYPERPALVFKDRRWTYQELNRERDLSARRGGTLKTHHGYGTQWPDRGNCL